MDRRDFLKTTSALMAGCSLPAGMAPDVQAEDARRPAFESNLRDRLWMWGHDSGVYDGPNGIYNIPQSKPIGMADAIRSMGIPNVCVIRGGIADAAYREQFRDVKRIAWNLSSGSNESYQALKEPVLRLPETMPNLTGYYLDDFFRFGDRPGFDRNAETDMAPAALSLDELKRLHDELASHPRRLELSMVLYTHLLCPAIKPALRHVDVVSLWIWNGGDIDQIERSFQTYRALAPEKPTLLGIYMWDFGGARELSVERMAKQLDYALKLFKEGRIDGMIFHCTPLCNKNLAAVNLARDWIAQHGNQHREE